LKTRFAPRRILAEQPILHRREDGRLVRGFIDVLLETEAGLIVIDHKSSPQPRQDWPLEAVDYAGQLALCAAALEATGHPVAECWLHFPVTGGAVRIEAGARAAAAR
jgi:ATP-dependent helicase/nuclease subunit A